MLPSAERHLKSDRAKGHIIQCVNTTTSASGLYYTYNLALALSEAGHRVLLTDLLPYEASVARMLSLGGQGEPASDESTLKWKEEELVVRPGLDDWLESYVPHAHAMRTIHKQWAEEGLVPTYEMASVSQALATAGPLPYFYHETAGFSLLPGPFGEPDKLTQEAYQKFLAVAQEDFDYVLVLTHSLDRENIPQLRKVLTTMSKSILFYGPTEQSLAFEAYRDLHTWLSDPADPLQQKHNSLGLVITDANREHSDLWRINPYRDKDSAADFWELFGYPVVGAFPSSRVALNANLSIEMLDRNSYSPTVSSDSFHCFKKLAKILLR